MFRPLNAPEQVISWENQGHQRQLAQRRSGPVSRIVVLTCRDVVTGVAFTLHLGHRSKRLYKMAFCPVCFPDGDVEIAVGGGLQ